MEALRRAADQVMEEEGRLVWGKVRHLQVEIIVGSGSGAMASAYRLRLWFAAGSVLQAMLDRRALHRALRMPPFA